MKTLNKFKIKNIILNNRVCIAPMCQYSAKNGNPTGWHYFHLKKLMHSGAGLMMIESTSVSKNGMITENDLLLKNRDNQKKFNNSCNFLTFA